MRYFIGADPGSKGGLAIIRESGEIVKVCEFENGVPKSNFGEASGGFSYLDCAAVERSKMLRGHTNAALEYGFNCGRIWQYLEDRGVAIEAVHPREWQSAHGVLVNGADTKALARQVLTQLYGEDELRKHGIIGKSGGYHDGPGDALLIARWLRDKKRLEKANG